MRAAAARLFLAALLVAVPFGAAACGGDDGSQTAGGTTATETDDAPRGAYGRQRERQGSAPAESAIETIVVRDGRPVGGVAELEVDAGEEVRFRVRSDAADEIHVHGYELTEEIPAGEPRTIAFPADIEGIFEVELHGSSEQIAELRVSP